MSDVSGAQPAQRRRARDRSLAWRILVVVVALNLVVVGGVQVAVYALQQQWVRRQQGENLAASLVPFLLDTYTTERLGNAASEARRLLLSPVIGEHFRDVVVTSGRPPYSSAVYLNPRGAVGRDPDQFPLEEILAGMLRASSQEGLVPVADGYCCVVRDGDQVAGRLWFVPLLDVEPPELPLWFLPGAVAASALLFGLALYWVIARSVARPLRAVGSAAARVGTGAYDVRLPALHGVPELQSLVESFNAMAEKVQGHTSDLQSAVEAAVAEAKQTERALVQSSRLATVGTLAAGIAHEINNPIGGMLNAVHRLLADASLSERQRQYLELVQGGLQRVARTARKVLDFSPKAASAQPFALRQAVEGARALVEHRLSRGGTAFVVELPDDLPLAYGDLHEIQQVLLNLFLNSLDALEQVRRAGSIRVTANAVPGGLRFVVRDDGPGMDPKDLGRVMDPFFTKKERPDASGLGMFISYSIVQNHGGTMTVESAPGAGFWTTITLPSAPDGDARRAAGGGARQGGAPDGRAGGPGSTSGDAGGSSAPRVAPQGP